MLRFCSRALYTFAQQKFIIKRSSYLVKAPPSKPPNSYVMFVADQIRGKSLRATQGLKQATQKWKALSAAEKKVYEDKYKAAIEEYNKVKGQYHETYVIPFQSTNSQALATSYIYSTKGVTVPQNSPLQAYSQKVQQLKRQLNPQQLQEFKKQSEQINTERKTFAEQYKFPELKHKTERSYNLSNSHYKELSPRQRTKNFKQYVKDWQNSVQQWLETNKISLGFKDFKRLYNKELKKEQTKRNESTEEATLSTKAKAAKSAVKQVNDSDKK